MSLQPQPIPDVPEATRCVAFAAFPKGALCLRLHDAIGTVFADEQFADLYPRVGQPAAAPWRLALVTILQFLEGLSDRQAAQAVRSRIDWKYLLGLELTDPGFDWSVLSEFRMRLIAGHAEMQLLETLLTACRERGWVKVRGHQRTDSTHVLSTARELNRLELVVETLRLVLNHIALIALEWLQAHLLPEWGDRYAQRADDYHFPQSKSAHLALCEQVGRDGQLLLHWMAEATTPEAVIRLPALAILREIWDQQYRQTEGTLHWRQGGELGMASLRIDTPYDLDARYSQKRGRPWTGYKVHLTETCDADLPHLITDVTTTVATVPDVLETAAIEAALVARGLPPAQHLVDSG